MFFDETIGNNSRFFGCFCVTRQALRNNCGHCQSDRTDWLLSAKDDRPWTEISWRLLTSRKSMWLSNQGKMYGKVIAQQSDCVRSIASPLAASNLTNICWC